ncbi:MAG TPA: bis(5'-nucleosyl)-tetraphosphatase (symmetrical) YqeK, partial [Dehalococcoidia bacterium]|nr:bis(5'-nucleosyl)-tetraphosphatase (symmetrical) YqeK [Dehalococcoidia bacterium]
MRAEDLRRRMGHLPDGLLRHIDRVVGEALVLAEAHGLDADHVALAAQGHDLARATPPDQLLRLALELGLNVSDVDRADPILLHGPVGAELLAREYGIEEPGVLRAARYHTTSYPGLGSLESVVFLADKLEPDKLRRDDALRPVRERALADLDDGVRAMVDLLTKRAVERGWALHPWL